MLAAVVVGAVLNHRGVPLHADAAPLFADWLPHAGPGTSAVLALAVLVVWRGPDLAARLRFRALLAVGYLAALAWTLSLAMVDGWSRGLANRLTPQAEYLHDLPRVHGVGEMLAAFASHIVDFQPGSWATHVAGHPPGAFLVFVLLDRAGLHGGGPAALLCVLVGASAPVSVTAALRWLHDEDGARAALPFLVLLPGAVWVGASGDGLFAGVLAAGLALLAAHQWWLALPGGLLLGASLYLSYGLVLAGGLAVGVLVLRDRRRWAAAAAGAAGVLAVAAAFTAAGFDWFTGYQLVVRRYYQGWAAQRPYAYWVWADLAALVLSSGPVLAPALARAGRAAFGAGARRAPTVWLPALALAAVLAADLSGLSKAEVERIWLPYEVWLLAATAWLPPRLRRPALALQALVALLVNHLLLTNW